MQSVTQELTLFKIFYIINAKKDAHMKMVPRLLVVDDEPEFRTLLAQALENEGFSVTQASDGAEAVAAVREYTFDLALLDIRMPKLDGIEVLKIIKSESPTTDCIMITGHQDVQLAVEAIKLGAREFLPKPLKIEDIMVRVISVLRIHMADKHIKDIQANFTSKLLHDLLAPLRTLKSAIDYLENSSSDSTSNQHIKIFQSINDTIKNMDSLLNDMIDLSLFESGRVDIEKIPTNFDELVPIVCSRFYPQLTSKNIKLAINVDQNVPTIPIDPGKIEQVINNVLDNAIKYTSVGGKISLNVSTVNLTIDQTTREYVEVVVVDTGAGIPRAEIPFVFDKYKEFLTGKSSEKKTTGMGLAICKSIIEAHQGKMTAESEVGKGSTFKFYLPIDSV